MLETFSAMHIGAFAAVVSLFLWLDLRQHRRDQPVSLGNAAGWSLVWIAVSFAFAGFVAHEFGKDMAALFLAGYLLEESLSVDNLFVFMAVFASFGVRDAYQHRVLYYGILGAIVLRLLFVTLGTGLLLAGELNPALHTSVFSLFGIAVLWSAAQMYRSRM